MTNALSTASTYSGLRFLLYTRTLRSMNALGSSTETLLLSMWKQCLSGYSWKKFTESTGFLFFML